MSEIANANQALEAAKNPDTSPADLAYIAEYFPQCHPLVATHPNTYPGLLDWLIQYGDEEAAAAAATRKTAETPAPNQNITPHASDEPQKPIPESNTPVTDVPARIRPTNTSASDIPTAEKPTAEPAESKISISNYGGRPSEPVESNNGLSAVLGEAATEAKSEIREMWRSEGDDPVEKWMNRGEIIWGVGKFIVIGIIVVVAAVVFFQSCGSTMTAKGVTCSEYNKMSLSKQNETIDTLLSAHGKEKGGLNLISAHARIMMGCAGDGSKTVDSVVNWD